MSQSLLLLLRSCNLLAGNCLFITRRTLKLRVQNWIFALETACLGVNIPDLFQHYIVFISLTMLHLIVLIPPFCLTIRLDDDCFNSMAKWGKREAFEICWRYSNYE